MAHSVEMPALGESVTEGTVTRWLKQEGDTVAVDEPLLEVSTDKVDTEIPSPAAGVLQHIVIGEDQTVEVGAQLALIGDEAAAAETPRAAEGPAEQASASGAAEAPSSRPNSGAGTTVSMPALGESVTEGTVTRWLKQEGDTVAVDEPLLEVSTDKVDTEIPSPVAGTVVQIMVGEDQTVEVGAQLAVVGSAEQPTPEQPAPEQPAPEQPAPEQPPTTGPQPGDGQGAAPYVTPLVRRLAAEHDLDLNTVQGTGVGGRIRKQDVLAAIEPTPAQPEPAPEPAAAAQPAADTAPAPPRAAPRTPTAPQTADLRGSTQKLSRMRRVIANRMVESLQVSAQLTTVVEADITRIARLRDQAKQDFQAREGVRLSFLPFFARATVEALKQHSVVNASLDADATEVTYHDAEHLGIAVDTERGLLVPVMHDAGDLNLGGLARRIADLADRARRADITPDEMGGGTFTLSNTGSRGALFDTPIINQPQVGILGTGSVVKRPVVLSDTDDAGGDVIAVRWMTHLALSYDHRLVDGADAARFLNTVKQRLEEGAFEADLGL